MDEGSFFEFLFRINYTSPEERYLPDGEQRFLELLRIVSISGEEGYDVACYLFRTQSRSHATTEERQMPVAAVGM